MRPINAHCAWTEYCVPFIISLSHLWRSRDITNKPAGLGYHVTTSHVMPTRAKPHIRPKQPTGELAPADPTQDSLASPPGRRPRLSRMALHVGFEVGCRCEQGEDEGAGRQQGDEVGVPAVALHDEGDGDAGTRRAQIRDPPAGADARPTTSEPKRGLLRCSGGLTPLLADQAQPGGNELCPMLQIVLTCQAVKRQQLKPKSAFKANVAEAAGGMRCRSACGTTLHAQTLFRKGVQTPRR